LFVAAAVLSIPMVAPVAADRWDTWAWLGASVIGTAPLMWSWPWAAVASLAAAVTSAVVAVVFVGDVLQHAALTLGVGAALALVNGAPVWLWELLVRAEATQEVEARAAAADERNRFGRDVHDILGHDLTVIALKAELAARTAEADPVSSARVAEEVRALAESALGRLRGALAPRRQDIDVRSEVDQMARILAAAGLHTDVDAGDVDASTSALRALTMAVKEATTNVLRHSDAQRCRIVLRSDGDRVRLEVTNDQPRPGRSSRGPTRSGPEASGSAAAVPGRTSSGVAGLRERVAGVGGTVAVHRRADSFTIEVSVPAGALDEEPAGHG
jgi:two-component system sensor histidine kinase DesK